MNHDPRAPGEEPTAFWRSRYAVGLIVLGAIAGYFLLSEHRAHFLGALPFVLLLGCPLMHVFMHHRHGRYPRHRTGEPVAGVPVAPLASAAGERP